MFFMERKLKHLEFIQEAIYRMASNSFMLKGWAVTLVVALFALSAKDSNHDYIWIVYFPVVIFWILDGYFLSQEKLFRSLYDHVRKLDEHKIDFSMDTDKFKQAGGYGLDLMGLPTLLIFYVPFIVLMLIITYLTNFL